MESLLITFHGKFHFVCMHVIPNTVKGHTCIMMNITVMSFISLKLHNGKHTFHLELAVVKLNEIETSLKYSI